MAINVHDAPPCSSGSTAL